MSTTHATRRNGALLPLTRAGWWVIERGFGALHQYRSCTLASLPEPQHVMGRHVSAEALQRQLAHRLTDHDLLDRGVGALVGEDLAAARLAAQPRGHDHDRADGGVVVAALEADAAEGGVADRHADAEAELVAALAPPAPAGLETLAHGDRHAHGALLVVGLRHGIVEEDEDAVTGEVLEGATVLDDQAAHLRVVLAQHVQQLFRLRRLGEGGEATQAAEDGRHDAAVAAQ